MSMKRTRIWLSSAAAMLALAACSGDHPATAQDIRQKIDRGEFNAAVVLLKASLQADPESAELRLLLGRTLLIQQQPQLAEVEFRKALGSPALRNDVVPLLAESMLGARAAQKLLDEFGSVQLDRPEAQLALQASLVQAYLDLGKDDRADALLTKLLIQAPDKSQLQLLDARRMAAAGNVKGAVDRLNQLVAREPANAAALLLLGDVRSVVDKDDSATLPLYRKVLEVDRSSLAAHSAVITILLRQQDLAAAEQAFADLKKVRPAHPQTRYMEARLALSKSDRKRARELTQQLLAQAPQSVSALQLAALVEMQDGAYTRAESHLSKAANLDKDSVSVRRLLAETYSRSGQPERALATLKPLLDANTADERVLRLAADALMLTGEPERAGELYALAAKAQPDDVQLRTALALVELAKGRTDDGLRALRDIASAQPDDAQTDLVLVGTLLQRRDFSAALRAMDVMEAKKPDAPGIDLIRGRIHLMRNDRAAARSSLERAVAKHPQNYPSMAALALLDMSENRAQEALKRYEVFLATNPPDAVRSLALRGLAGIKFNAKAPQDVVIQHLRDAVAADPMSEPAAVMLVDGLLRGQQVEAAVNAAQTALARLPEAPALLDALGRAQMASGDMRQAGATFAKVIRLRPRSAVAHLRLGQIQMLSGDAKGAVSGYLRALALDPDLAEAQSSLARFAQAKGQLEPVLVAVRQLQREFPTQAFPHRIEGDVHLARRAFDDAVTAYRSGLSKQRAGRLPVRLHRALLSSGNDAEAQRMADAWLKSQPGDQGFLQHVADHAMIEKDYRLAEIYYRKLIAVAPTQFHALNNLAWLLTRSKQPGAVAFAERALNAAPGQVAIMDTLAHALVAERQNAKAVALAEQILAREGSSAGLQLSMAQVYADAGQQAKALELLAVLDKGQASADVKAAAAQLRQKLAPGG